LALKSRLAGLDAAASVGKTTFADNARLAVDVAVWLGELGLERYVEAFLDNHVTADVLVRLSPDDLKEIGVASVGHRRLILDAIALLRQRQSSESRETTSFQLPAEVAPQGQLTARLERRQLSVMFCDLVGSTSLSVILDPEDFREVINTYHSRIATVIERFGGFVAEYLGDGMVAYFGWPFATEWDAEHAISAGLESIRAIKSIEFGGKECRVRLGIATGLVIVGGSTPRRLKTQSAMGQTLNLAARLQAVAEPDTVVIDETTHGRVGALFICDPLPPAQIKGFLKPVGAWRVRGRSGIQSRFEARHRSTVTPLIGREWELDFLLGRWHEARQGAGQVVLVSGEPGIGKSRLVAEFEANLADSSCYRLRYFCSPQHRNTALYPVIAELEHAAKFERADSAAERLQKLRGHLSATSPSEQDLALFADLLSIQSSALQPLNASPQHKKEMTFAALIRRMERLSQRQLVAVVLEDVHWSDPTTREFFQLFAARVADLPILLIFTFRPEVDRAMPESR
jgi:class 3 adenylate cyclase